VQAGEAANAIPQHGLLRGTLRTADHATWGELEGKIRTLIEQVLAPTGVTFEIDHVRGVPPVVNEEVSAGMLADSAITILGPDAATGTEQSSGGEDFAWFLDHVPGAMARLGVWSGSGPMRDIHQPTFDLDERALPFGVRVLTRAALSALSHTGEPPVPPL
jgi:amidohydrolase